jgi:hypothetical protein
MKRTLIMILLCGLVMAAHAATAEAITVRGTLRYLDGDGAPAPIRRARVDVRVFRGRPLIWWWETEATAVTNENGFFSVDMPFIASDVRYSLHVYATNPAAQVFTPDFYTIPFYREPGAPGPQTEFVASGPTSILTFDNLFTDLWATRPFNIADSILRGFDYANARRDPRQSDVNARVDVLLNTVGSTYYDPVSHAIRMDAGIFGMDDFTILHEYGHRLEEQLSSFFGIAAVHDGCRADAGASYVSPGYAWMEGFASYFAEAVARDAGNDASGLPLVDGPRRRCRSRCSSPARCST